METIRIEPLNDPSRSLLRLAYFFVCDPAGRDNPFRSRLTTFVRSIRDMNFRK